MPQGMVTSKAPYIIHNKADVRTGFKAAMDEADTPQEVLACPFGCGAEDVDMLGYCNHLIGFCNARLPEGVVKNPGGVKVEVLGPPDPIMQRRSVVRGKDIPLEFGDYLVRYTTTSRVYRENPPKPPDYPRPAVMNPATAAAIAEAVEKAKAEFAAALVAENSREKAVNHSPPERPGTNPVTAPENPAPTPTPQGPGEPVHPSIPPQVDKPSTTEKPEEKKKK